MESMADIGNISNEEFDRLLPRLDLNAPEYQLTYKDSGTSLGLKISARDKKFGKWMPKNAAANPEAQVVAYHLATYLNMPKIVVPAGHYTVQGRAYEEFRQMVRRASERNSLRVENQQAILNAMAKSPGSMAGVFVPDVPKNTELTELQNTGGNTINSSHPLAKFIQASGAMPSRERAITFRGLKTKDGKLASASEFELAKQLSAIMVLDILTGQWDRWSGGNMEGAFDKSGRAFLISRDNGGASMAGRGVAQKYFGIVSRFDRKLIRSVKQLEEALEHNPAAVVRDLELKSDPKYLHARCDQILDQVKALVARYGEERVYFPE